MDVVGSICDVSRMDVSGRAALRKKNVACFFATSIVSNIQSPCRCGSRGQSIDNLEFIPTQYIVYLGAVFHLKECIVFPWNIY